MFYPSTLSNFVNSYDLLIFLLVLVFIRVLIVIIILLFLIFIIGFKRFSEEEQRSPFECGFLPQSQKRAPFSIHFFLISLVFLVFDIELVLLFPWFLSYRQQYRTFIFYLFIIFLISVGLIHEWNAKILEWREFRQS